MKQSDLLIVNFVSTAIRVVAMIVIGFFLTRILVKQLGLELFGLFTTIGASGMMLMMFTNTLQLSIAREMGVSVGKGDPEKISEAFSSSFFIQLVAGTAFGLVGIVSAGWITSGLTVPEGYEYATWICLVMTFLQFAAGIFASPYGAMIRAHQHLSTIAALQLFSRIAIFAAALLMIVWPYDKLIFFVAANLVCNVVAQLIHVWIAWRRYPESVPRVSRFSRTSAKSIFRYGSLALMGGIGGQIRRNGIAIILNIFFGNLVTAANGIALRLSNLVAQFVEIITPVVQPAMNSNVGSGNQNVIFRLVTLSSTLGLAIVIPVAIPLLFDTESILKFWLGVELPQYAALFSQLIVLTFVVTMISKGHAMALHARGNIGRLTLINQGLVILGILIAALIACPLQKYPWLLPAGELVGLILATAIWQPWWVAKTLNISNRSWYRYTVWPAFLFVVSNLILVLLITYWLPTSMVRALLLGAGSGCLCFAILWIAGLFDSERTQLLRFLRNAVRKIFGALRHSPNF